MDLNLSMQRILNGASSQNSHNRQSQSFSNRGIESLPTRGFPISETQQQSRGFNSSSRDTQCSNFNIASGPRQSMEDFLLLDGQDLYTRDNSYQNFPAFAIGPTRVSLPQRHSYPEDAQKSKFMTNVDRHLKTSHSVHQNQPVNPFHERLPNVQHDQSPISELATNMLFQRTMPPRDFMPNISRPHQSTNELPNFFQSINLDRLKRLQPAKQQVTPPFNLSGFKYSPKDRQSPTSSSPFAPNSSPTARVTLRRATIRSAPTTECTGGEELGFEENTRPATPPELTQPSSQPSHDSNRTAHTNSFKHSPPIVHGIQLVSPYDLPDRLRQIFPYELFNAVQSQCYEPIYKSNNNVVISAPTGCGKTILLELAICKLIEGHKSGEFKIVYQAPTKSLCSERTRDWGRKFSHLNLTCAELTGDTNQHEMIKVRDASIIITTPEKWDSITRKWKDHQKLLQLVKLFLIDEVHVLKDARGATLEAVVSRMKSSDSNVRFVALSATVPNSEDIAVWLGKNCTQKDVPAHLHRFGEEFRPVKLKKHVYGFDGQANDFVFEKVLDGKLPGLIQKHSQKKPIMVFCLTRKACEKTAALLADWWSRQRDIDRTWPAPTQRTRVGKKELQEVMLCGVSFHHAGLDQQDRLAVETSYLKGDTNVICCTSTLAVGVNLPCHLVVLKGTVGYQGGDGPAELSDIEVMQMLGRAGRPQFDDSAVAIIMTRKSNIDRYQKMVSGQDVLESTLHLNLIEHLNSEVGLGSIKTLHEAKNWLMGTFLSVRMRLNPDYYKLEGIPLERDTDHRLELVCERDLKLLQDHQLVSRNDSFMCTEYGNAMSRYMVTFDTMKSILSLPEQATTEDILQNICQSSEFQDLRLKANEKADLREVNKSPFIKYPIKGTIHTTAHKISLIIQSQLGGVDLPPSSKEGPGAQNHYQSQYSTEKKIVFERVQRLIRCIVDCKAFDCDAISTRHALGLTRSLAAEYWENSNLQLRQIPQIGPATNRKLAAGNVNSVEQLASMDTASIERIMGRNPPYGRKLLDTMTGFPLLTLSVNILGTAPSKPGENPKVKIKACLGFKNPNVPVWQRKRPSITFTAESSNGTLVFFWRANISKLDQGTDVDFIAELCGPGDSITCYVSCDEIVGTIQSLNVTSNIPASAFPPADIVDKGFAPVAKNSQRETDEFGGDDFDDDDMMAAVKSADDLGGYDSDEFVDIDEMETAARISNEETAGTLESTQMKNGRWKCNHTCRSGKLLKNGQVCKHKCCTEGLDKPRKPRKRSLYGIGESSSTNQSVMNKTQPTGSLSKSQKKKVFQTHFRSSKQGDDEEVEVINLVDTLSPIPYSKLAPREYRKLHNLHTNVQKDKNVGISKQKPQYSYASTDSPVLPFLKGSQTEDDPFYSVNNSAVFISDDDVRSPSKSVNMNTSECDPKSSPTSSNSKNSIESIEAAIVDRIESTEYGIQPSLNVDVGFENQVFDFEAFDEWPRKEESNIELFSSPLLRDTRTRSQVLGVQTMPQTSDSMKRSGSSSPARLDVKHRRVTMGEPPAKEQTFNQEKGERGSRPAWVDEMDPEIIKSLVGIVDFAE